MAYSSILGAESAPSHPSGRSADLLGPSDRSDSGSDAMGTSESHEDSDSSGTGERGAAVGTDGREGGDIMPDRILNMADEELPDADLDSVELTDLDADEDSDETSDDEEKPR